MITPVSIGLLCCVSCANKHRHSWKLRCGRVGRRYWSSDCCCAKNSAQLLIKSRWSLHNTTDCSLLCAWLRSQLLGRIHAASPILPTLLLLPQASSPSQHPSKSHHQVVTRQPENESRSISPQSTRHLLQIGDGTRVNRCCVQTLCSKHSVFAIVPCSLRNKRTRTLT